MQKIFKSVLSLCLAVAICLGIPAVTNTAVTEYVVADAATTTAESYYNGITAKSGTALLGQLHDLIVETHKTYTSYDDCKRYGPTTDPGLDGKGVMEFYTHETIMNFVGSVGDWNREHVWCQSLSGGLWGTGGGGSDMHHIRPSESGLNSIRGNNKYGVVGSSGKEAWSRDTSKNNSMLGGHYIANSTFEPLDNVKGDVARIVMYVYTHYNNASNVGGTKESAKTHGNLPFTNVITASNEAAAKKMLLEWNALDPVDEIELYRNEKVYEIQGNRNPFIDNKSYAEAIWGDGTVVDPGTDPTPSDTLKSISLNETALTLNVGQSYGLTVTPNPSNASKSVTWTSSDSSVATVANGTVTAKSAGTATITATSTSNSSIKATATVTVKQPSTSTPSVTFGAGTYKMAIDLTAASDIGKVLYFNGQMMNNYYFGTTDSESSAAEVVVEEGEYGYTLKTGNKYLELVTSGEHVNVILQNSVTGEWQYNSELKTITWTIISSGIEYYLGTRTNGTKTYDTIAASDVQYITGNNASKVGVTQFIVEFVKLEESTPPVTPELESITINPPSVTLEEGEDTILTVTSVPSSVTAEVNWTSSNPSVAIVLSDGTVTAISAGTAIITATSKTNSSIKDTAIVTVEQPSTPTPPDTFEAGTYKLAINITATDLTKKVYFTGAIQNDYFGATSTDISKAVDVVVAEKDDGYTIKVGSQYLELQYYNDSNGATHAKLVLVNSSTREWSYNAELDVLTWRLTTNGHDYFLGAYTNSAGRTYDNVSANDVEYISGDNASNIGVSRFIATFEKPGETTPIEPDIPLEGIIVSPSDITLKEGETVKLSVETIPSNLTADIDWTSIIEWTSSNPLVATVSSDGTVTAISAGTAIITATSNENTAIKASATVTVEALPEPPAPPELQSISINPSSITLVEGENTSLTVTSTPSEVTAEVNWTSSNPLVVTVSSDGKVTAISAGTATITATSKTNPAITAIATVTVEAAPPVVDEAKVKAFHDAVAAINGDGAIGPLNVWLTSINEAIDLYNNLSEADKEAAAEDISTLRAAIESYNKTIKAHNQAADSADKTALNGAGKFH